MINNIQKFTPILAVLGMLAACVDGIGPNYDTNQYCFEENYTDMIGKKWEFLSKIKFAIPTRIIHPDEAVTMEHNPSRLNFWLDDKGLIAKVTCG